jgi:hypothetical protein
MAVMAPPGSSASMKLSPRRISLGALAAAMAVATLTTLPRAIGQPPDNPRRGEHQESLLPAVKPPNRPPMVRLGFTDQSRPRQKGVVVYYDWLIDGRPQTYEMRPRIAWPATLKGPAPLLVEIASQAPPHTLEVRLYERIMASGIPGGRAVVRTCNLGKPAAGSCAITRNGEVWQAVIEGIPPGRTYYVAASAIWYIPSTVPQARSTARASETAAWLFRLETRSPTAPTRRSIAMEH